MIDWTNRRPSVAFWGLVRCITLRVECDRRDYSLPRHVDWRAPADFGTAVITVVVGRAVTKRRDLSRCALERRTGDVHSRLRHSPARSCLSVTLAVADCLMGTGQAATSPRKESISATVCSRLQLPITAVTCVDRYVKIYGSYRSRSAAANNSIVLGFQKAQSAWRGKLLPSPLHSGLGVCPPWRPMTLRSGPSPCRRRAVMSKFAHNRTGGGLSYADPAQCSKQ